MWHKKKKKRNETRPQGETMLVTTPSRAELLEMEERVIWTSDGDMVRYCTYSVFPKEPAGGSPLFNLYGQIIYNNARD